MAQKLAGLTVAMLAALQAAQASPLRKVPQPHVFGVKEALKKKALSHPRVVEALKVFPELGQKHDVQVD